MSSFICSPKHFNSIEASVKHLAYSNEFYFPYSFKKAFPELYNKREHTFDLMDNTIESVMNDLRSLNALCVTLQYKHNYQGTLDTQIKAETDNLMNNRRELKLLSKIELLKALRCVNYQIELEHLKELRDLTEGEENAMFFMYELMDTLAFDIVSALPQYDKAGWELA